MAFFETPVCKSEKQLSCRSVLWPWDYEILKLSHQSQHLRNILCIHITPRTQVLGFFSSPRVKLPKLMDGEQYMKRTMRHLILALQWSQCFAVWHLSRAQLTNAVVVSSSWGQLIPWVSGSCNSCQSAVTGVCRKPSWSFGFLEVPDMQLLAGKQQDLGATLSPPQNSPSSKTVNRGLGQQDHVVAADVLMLFKGKQALCCMPGLMSETARIVKILLSPAFAIFNVLWKTTSCNGINLSMNQNSPDLHLKPLVLFHYHTLRGNQRFLANTFIKIMQSTSPF